MALYGSKVFAPRNVDIYLEQIFGKKSLVKTSVLSLQLCGEKKDKKMVIELFYFKVLTYIHSLLTYILYS
jgi:hypothetical protein